MYREDISKTNQGGLKQRKLVPKEVVHHANCENPSRCLISLYKLYNSLCPKNRPAHSFFYLTPLAKPKKDCWYKASPVGHGKLAEVVPRLMKSAVMEGYFTNHSLHVTAATRMYDAQLDEATIISRTGHRFVDGVRAYKRTSEKLRELSSAVLNTQKKQKLEPIPGSADKKSDVAGSENTAPVVSPFAKPPSIPGIHFGSATNFTINLTFDSRAVQTCLSLLLLCTIVLVWFHIMKFNVISGHAM